MRPLPPGSKPHWQSTSVCFSGQPFTCCLAGLGKPFLKAAQLLNSASGSSAGAEMPTPDGSCCQEAKGQPASKGPAHGLLTVRDWKHTPSTTWHSRGWADKWKGGRPYPKATLKHLNAAPDLDNQARPPARHWPLPTHSHNPQTCLRVSSHRESPCLCVTNVCFFWNGAQYLLIWSWGRRASLTVTWCSKKPPELPWEKVKIETPAQCGTTQRRPDNNVKHLGVYPWNVTLLHSSDVSYLWRGPGTHACTKAQQMCRLPHEVLCVCVSIL